MGYPDKAIEAIRSAQMDDRWGAFGGKACACVWGGGVAGARAVGRAGEGPPGLAGLGLRAGLAARRPLTAPAAAAAAPPPARRGYNSPLDISMHIDRILTEIPVSLTTFEDALGEIFPKTAKAA
jgi:hypothetical protein